MPLSDRIQRFFLVTVPLRSYDFVKFKGIEIFGMVFLTLLSYYEKDEYATVRQDPRVLPRRCLIPFRSYDFVKFKEIEIFGMVR